jgi:predicted lipid-binding transport protein (Tim44 family)
MNYSFEYLDIILLAMIAGFIFLRLRGILGKKSGYEDDISNSFPHDMPEMKTAEKKPNYRNFDESAKKNFIEGAKMAYETIITNFSKGSIKEIKSLLDKKVLNQFQEAISNREKNGIKSETTFIGINSAEIKNHEQKGNMLEVTVDFISEIISCNRDKDSKILTGDPEKVKKVYDTWRFSKNLNSNDPNWLLIETNI